jgi:23S rRNA (adenine2503-C2)-methyltransferase
MHAKELYREAYKNLSRSPWLRPGLPKVLQNHCATHFTAQLGVALKAEVQSGYDQSVKFRSELGDGTAVETVLMPEKKRITLCVSTQVGCAQGCVFCHTGRMGLLRHLMSHEIVGQIIAAKHWIAEHPEWLKRVGFNSADAISNIVFMGMGEPLDNVEQVCKAVETMTDPYGLALGMRHISVSTAGHLPGLKELLTRLKSVRLALSVHNTDPVKRAKIMPIEKNWPLFEVVSYLEKEMPVNGGSVMIQYTLIAGVNDFVADAEGVAEIAARLNAKVNLIPLNAVSVSRLKAPNELSVQAFRDVLHRRGIRVMVRYSKGQDIAAACGQLVVAN